MEDFIGTYGNRLILAVVGVGVALLLLAIVLWFIRRRGGSSPFIRGGKNRQPRLQVLDATAVDARRRLVLVRRDNVEHLVMIGGPTDIVIESGIGAIPFMKDVRDPQDTPLVTQRSERDLTSDRPRSLSAAPQDEPKLREVPVPDPVAAKATVTPPAPQPEPRRPNVVPPQASPSYAASSVPSSSAPPSSRENSPVRPAATQQRSPAPVPPTPAATTAAAATLVTPPPMAPRPPVVTPVAAAPVVTQAPAPSIDAPVSAATQPVPAEPLAPRAVAREPIAPSIPAMSASAAAMAALSDADVRASTAQSAPDASPLSTPAASTQAPAFGAQRPEAELRPHPAPVLDVEPVASTSNDQAINQDNAIDFLDAARDRVLPTYQTPPTLHASATPAKPEPLAPSDNGPVFGDQLTSDFESFLEAEIAKNNAASTPSVSLDPPPRAVASEAELTLTEAEDKPADDRVQKEMARIFGEMSVTRDR